VLSVLGCNHEVFSTIVYVNCDTFVRRL